MSMERQSWDILVSGAGVAGLTAAAVFGAAGFSVLCIDPEAPVTSLGQPKVDRRTTAFLQPARDLLTQVGVWDGLEPQATALQVMRIVDAGGADALPRVSREFDARDISDLPFGWNFPNWILRRTLVARLDQLDTVDFRTGVGFKSMVTRTNEALVTLSDGSAHRAKLVIGADGRDSPVRKAAGISVQTTRYGQKAVVFMVTHALPHDFVSTEVHRTGGPFTLVPLPDLEGQPCSAVVWMDTGANALALAALPPEVFNDRATERSAGVYGRLTLASPRQVWPIIAQVADRVSAERVALIAEAAHVLPPIGAQGLNMSLADIACLRDLATQNPDQLGDSAMLNSFHRQRHSDIRLRVAGVDALNRASIAGSPVMRDLRAKGIEALYAVTPIRKSLMQLGLGVKQ